MFATIEPAPPDPIFGLLEAFRADPAPGKMTLGAGVYQDEEGRTPVLAAVKAAEARILEEEDTKNYLPIDGLEAFRRWVPELVLGSSHPVLAEERTAALQAPGGTGALRVFADLWADLAPESTVWLSDPTWVNHGGIFGAAHLATRSYPYYDPATGSLAYEAMLEALGQVEAGDLVVLHGTCHNPTGVDPTTPQWESIAGVLGERGAVPLVDIAYQGFAEGLEEDAFGVRLLAERLPEIAVCSSFSKTMGLYRERVGALIVTASSPSAARAVSSRAKRVARVLYSNPPSHGGRVAATVLGDPELRRRWEEELGTMRSRIAAVRRRLVEELDRRGVGLRKTGNDFIVAQRGMFSFTGLDGEAVRRLREEHSVYLIGSGRINVAGLHEGNLGRFCDAVAAVI